MRYAIPSGENLAVKITKVCMEQLLYQTIYCSHTNILYHITSFLHPFFIQICLFDIYVRLFFIQ